MSGDECAGCSDGAACPGCGYEDDMISESPEWRYISSTGSVKGLERSTAITTFLRHDNNVGAVELRPARSRSVIDRVRALRMNRISTTRPLMSGEASKIALFKLANDAAQHFDLGQGARETLGAILHAYVDKAKRPVGRDRAKIVAAALEKVVELYNLGISKGEIKAFFNIDDNELWDGIKKLNDAGALDAIKAAQASVGPARGQRSLERVLTYINRIVDQLGLPHPIKLQALDFVRKSLSVPGKTPYGKKPEAIAAAAVYLVARLNGFEVSQSDVARAVDLKESTVRKLYRYLMSDVVVVVDV